MPLQKQSAIISLGQGLETKTDPRQTVAGKMEVLQNSKFTVGEEFSKRDGYSLITTTTSGVGQSVAGYNDELVSFDKYNLYSYVSATGNDANKGYCECIDVAAAEIYLPATTVSTGSSGVLEDSWPVNSAVHSSGYTIYTYNASLYAIVDSNTGNVIVSQQNVTNTSSDHNNYGIKPIAIGNYFVLLYVNNTAGSIEYVAIPVATPSTPNAAVSIDTTNTSPNKAIYDASLATDGSKIFIAYAKTTNCLVRSLSSALALSSATTVAVANALQTINVWLNDLSTTPEVWVGVYNPTSSNFKYFVLTQSSLSSVLALTQIDNDASGVMITGIAVANGVSMIYLELQDLGPDGATRQNPSYYCSANNAGTVSSVMLMQRGASFMSKPFHLDGNTNQNFFLMAYGGKSTISVNPTYFLMRHNAYSGSVIANVQPDIAAKICQGSALAPRALSTRDSFLLTDVYLTSTTKFQVAVARSTGIDLVQGVAFGVFGVFKYTFNIANSDSYLFQIAAQTLNYTGGFLWMYDSNKPVENNFHVFPDNFSATPTTGGSMASSNTYSYKAVYRWTDNKGKTHQSETSNAVSATLGGSDTAVTLVIPACNFTEKTDNTVYVDVYRTTPTETSTVTYYNIGASKTFARIDKTVTITDILPDATIKSNGIIYTNGGVVDNSGGPPCNGIAIFDSRLFIIDAENRNTLWYSKQILDTTPVEMSQDFTFFIDPRFGDITAIATMDDKLIIFKKTACFYVYGTGPDSTGANSGFSDAIFVTSDVGCVDPRSVIRTPDGLMFKSLKGIFLLGRDLSMSYIGAPVESFNSYTVIGAQLIPDTTEVRFALTGTSTVLNYDYFYRQWSAYTNYPAVATTLYNNQFTFINSSGQNFEEVPGQYNDNGTAIYQTFTTSWLSLAGLQGFQRIYSVYLLTKYYSAHNLTVGIAYDFDDTIVQTINLDDTSLATALGNSVVQWRLNIDRQKCQSIRLTITEIADPTNPVNGQGLSLEAMNILIGTKLSFPKVPAIQEATS